MKIALFVSNYSIATSVAIINACLFFAEHDVHVDIFSYNNIFEDRNVFQHENIRFFSIIDDQQSLRTFQGKHATSLWTRAVMKMAPAALQKMLMNRICKEQAVDDDIYFNLTDCILDKSREILRENAYTAFIGIEPAGLTWAELLGGGSEIPLLYWSLELYLESDQRFNGHYFRSMRRRAMIAHQKALVTIIQDKERAELLAKQDRVPISQFIYVPVALKGEPVTDKSFFLHDMLNIAKDKKIVLYLGNITENRLCLETAKAAADLPEDWVMVQHGWCPDKDYRQQIARFQSNKFFLSTDMLPYEQLIKIIASAHVGVSLYRAVSDNEKLSGAASSKTAQYLQCGLPVIVNNYASVRTIVQQYHHGICVDSPSQIPEALDQINLKYDEMRNNALECYREKFEISRYLNQVMDILKHGSRQD